MLSRTIGCCSGKLHVPVGCGPRFWFLTVGRVVRIAIHCQRMVQASIVLLSYDKRPDLRMEQGVLVYFSYILWYRSQRSTLEAHLCCIYIHSLPAPTGQFSQHFVAAPFCLTDRGYRIAVPRYIFANPLAYCGFLCVLSCFDVGGFKFDFLGRSVEILRRHLVLYSPTGHCGLMSTFRRWGWGTKTKKTPTHIT
jgi:hypothetical protein